jgi:hypothetical protein
MCKKTLRVLKTRSNLLMLALMATAPGAAADITFTQTVDGWWTNTYTWNAQNDSINTARGGDALGTVKNVWARVVQKNGSKVGNAVFCTTATKVFAGAFGDRWDVAVPAGTITDSDFWDCSAIGVELVECEGHAKVELASVGSPFGTLAATDLAAHELDENPTTRYVSIDPSAWDDQGVRDAGFDFAVYAYIDAGGMPVVLNHVDEVGLSTFTYDQVDAFGTGEPFDPQRLVIIGIDLDPTWDQLAQVSNGLNEFQWQLEPGGGMLFTDQGNFQILQAQPLFDQWNVSCAADLTEDGVLDFFDVSLFLQLFSSNDPAADWNDDGVFDFFDVLGFLDAFSAGCP